MVSGFFAMYPEVFADTDCSHQRIVYFPLASMVKAKKKVIKIEKYLIYYSVQYHTNMKEK